MHRTRIISLLTVSALALFALPALAQMYPGEDVIVNPAAIPPSGTSYPGVIRVHPPHRHHRKAAPKPEQTAAATPATIDTSSSSDATASPAPAESAPAEAAPAEAAPAETAPPPAPAKPKRQRRAAAAQSAAPAAGPSDSGLGFSFGQGEELPAQANKTAAKETPPPAAKPPAAAAASDSQAGLAKRGAILFEHNATDPQSSQMDGIKMLAGDLNAALEAGATQIQLEAFGGSPGDKSSEARRIALKRALAIRQLLIDNGVPSSKIITKAMGGITDGGEPDRVDIYIRAS